MLADVYFLNAVLLGLSIQFVKDRAHIFYIICWDYFHVLIVCSNQGDTGFAKVQIVDIKLAIFWWDKNGSYDIGKDPKNHINLKHYRMTGLCQFKLVWPNLFCDIC